jgi:hypothetical protein
MRLVMTLLVRDEAELVSHNISFHLQHGVDFVIATDNGSTDGTREDLIEFQRAGVLHLLDEAGDDFSQFRWVSRMAHLAREEFGADWILNCDADEFWFPSAGDLKVGLDGAEADVLRCQPRHMVFAHDLKAPADFRDIVHRVSRPCPPAALSDWLSDPLPAPFYYLDLGPKVLCRANGLIEVQQGNHAASYESGTCEAESDIAVYHYPIRSFAQFVRKIGRGGASCARNSILPAGICWQWRRWFRMMCEGHATRAFAETLPSADRLARDLHDGLVVVDSTLRDCLCISS